MPREYQVKINVDSTKAEGALAKFEQKAQRTFDKLNKTSFQPTAFINGINISIQKVMELASKEQQAASKIAKAQADVAKAKEKTKQENAKARQEAEKTAQAEAKAAADTAKARAASRAKIRAEEEATKRKSEETAKAMVKASKDEAKAVADAHAKIRAEEEKTRQAQERTAQTENKITQERIKGINQAYTNQQKANAAYIKGQQDRQKEAEKTRQQELKNDIEREKIAAKFVLQEQKKSNAAKQGSSEIIKGHQAVADNFTKVTGQMSNAWNQLKMIIGFAGVAGMLRSAFNEMKAMSDELITYQKVTGASAEQVSKVRSSAYKSAGRYGQTPSDFLASVAVMARAGYGEQSEAMADLATKTQLVGDMTSEAASKFLIAVDAGYQLKGNIESLSNVLDKANIIDNNYATSLSKVADAMTLIAPLSASMNVSIEETMAAIGTMSAVTQREGTEVARAYRMIALNIAKDTETEVEEGVKLTEDEIKSLNDILQVYAATELKAADAAGKLLSPMKAIEAISKAWRSGALNEQELFKVLNGIGGARYTNSIMALIKNFDMYEDMLNKFTTEMGSADAEVTAMTQGWTAKFNQLKVAWTEMVNNTVSEDFIRKLLDIAKGFLQWTGNLQTFVGVVGGSTVALKGLKAIVTGTASSFTGLGVAVGLAAAAIAALNAYQEQQKRNAQESARSAAESAENAYEQAKRVNELTRAYQELAKDGKIDSTELSEAESIQSEINTLVGELPGKYDLVKGSIDKNVTALQNLNKEQRKSSYIAAREAVNVAQKAVVDNGTFLGTFPGITAQFSNNEEYFAKAFAGSSYFKQEGLGHDSVWIKEQNPALRYIGDKTAESLVAAYDELCAVIDQATADGIDSKNYHTLIETRNSWKEVVESYREALDFLKKIESGNFDLESGDGGAGGAGGSGGTGGTDDAVKSWDRLAKAIENATNAKKAFDAATETTKADQAKDYASVYATLAEELKNGRVNSTATHAALQMLLGDEAYAATGGRVQALQEAWTGKRAGQMLSAAESYEILTGTYQNQNGQTVEGAGIAVLAEKVGMEVRDELGNYMLDFADTAKLEQLSSLTGVTVDALRAALNAYDQYDVTGTSTGAGHPQEQDGAKTPEEQLDTSIAEQTTATQENTAALNNLTATLGGEPAGGGSADGGSTGGGSGSPTAINGPKTAAKAIGIAEEGMGRTFEEQVWDNAFKQIAAAEGDLNAIDAISATAAKVITDNELNRQTTEGTGKTGLTFIDTSRFGAFGSEQYKGIKAASGKRIGGEMPVGLLSDEEKSEEDLVTSSVETAKGVEEILDKVDQIGTVEEDRKAALDYWEAMLVGHETGDFSGYTGPEDIVGDYQDYKELYGDNLGDELKHRAQESKIIAGVEPIISQYDLKTTLKSLEEGLNAENIPIVIDAVLNKYSLEEVIGSLDILTSENRTAVIQAAIAKYGKDAVIAELKKIATNNGGGWAAEIIAYLDGGSKEQTKKELKELTKSETKKIYTSVVTGKGGPVGVDLARMEAVGTTSFPGGLAMVNDGTGAEMVLDSHGAHVYGGGAPTVTNIERGAMIYTAEQTRSLIASVPHHATGTEANAAAQLAAELNAFFDYIRTGDTSYTLAGGGGSAGKGSSSGSASKPNADSQWDSLKELIEYIIKRLGKALEAQEKVIDAQINALQAQKSQRDEQNQIEELQKAVATAQQNLAEAQSQRSVRYIDDNGQWHWMADQKKVQQAQEELEKANKSFVDYLYDVSIEAQVKALEDEKTRLSDEYTGYKDLWSDILDAVATPTGDLVALIQFLTKNGTGAQRNGASAVRDRLISAMLGGSYSANYNEALGEIGKAAANNPSVPGISDAALAALIASSGTSVSSGAMLGALQSIAGNNPVVGNVGGSVANTDNSVQYFINGVQIGSDMANMPLSEILQRLSVYANASR